MGILDKLFNNHKVKNNAKSSMLGTPCKIRYGDTEVIGRYIGDPLEDPYSGSINFGTPDGTIFVSGRLYVEFNMTSADLIKLKEFEDDAISKNRWYHREHTGELDDIGKFMNYEDIKPIRL